MAGTATLKNTFKTIYYGGESPFYLNAADFDLSDYPPRDLDERINLEMDTLPFYATGQDTSSLRITPFKHINSVDLSQDNNKDAPNKNSNADDLKSVGVRFFGTITHPSSGVYYFDFYMTYYAAVWDPRIDPARMANALKTNGNDWNTIFTTANINLESPILPNKIAPHGASELLGFSPNFYPLSISALPTGTLIIPWYNQANTYNFVLKYQTINGRVSKIEVPANTVTNPLSNGSVNAFYSLGTNTYSIVGYTNNGSRIIDTQTVTVTKEAAKFTAYGLNPLGGKATFNYNNSSGVTDFKVTVTAGSDHPSRGYETNTVTYDNVPFSAGSGTKSFNYYMAPPADAEQVLVDLTVQIYYGSWGISTLYWDSN